VPAAIEQRDDAANPVNITAADLYRVVCVNAAPADNAEVVVNVPGGLWPGPGSWAPIYVYLQTTNPVKFQGPTGVTFRNPANGQASNSFAIASGSRYKWVILWSLNNIHRVM
jgi:hypothetical protein